MLSEVRSILQKKDPHLMKILQQPGMHELPQELTDSGAAMGKAIGQIIKRTDQNLQIQQDITCGAFINSKEALLAIEDSVFLYNSQEKFLISDHFIKCKARISDLVVYQDLVIVADGYYDPDTEKLIKVFRRNDLIKTISSPRFKSSYFHCSLLAQINAYGRVFTIFKDRLFFSCQEGFLHFIELTKPEFPCTKYSETVYNFQQLRASSTTLLGITTNGVVRLESDRFGKEKKYILKNTFTSLEIMDDYFFVNQYRTDSFGPNNYIHVYDIAFMPRNNYDLDLTESIRHMKAFKSNNRRMLIASTFGFGSVLFILEFLPKESSLSQLKRIDSVNPSTFCSWVNSIIPHPDQTSLLLVGPLGFLTSFKLKLDW